MSTEQCPLCFAPLEAQEVAPCMDCGNVPQELQHFADGRHTYAEYRIFGTLSLVLCNFCQVDFGSYDPTYFGLPSSASIGLERISFVRHIDPAQRIFDKVCLECHRRLSFLQFVSAARELHHATPNPPNEQTPCRELHPVH